MADGKNMIMMGGGNPGLSEKWKHKDECLRVTRSQEDDDVRMGLTIIAEVLGRAYVENAR